MGRINNVGTGYGFEPKGYYLTIGDDGQCSLVVVRGKKDKKKVVGDVEQQALLKAAGDDGEGGEKVLATALVPSVTANQWHTLKLRFEGSTITGYVDGKPVVSATDSYYTLGMAGLIAGATHDRLSTPYYDNLLIKPLDAPVPTPSVAVPGQTPMYGG